MSHPSIQKISGPAVQAGPMERLFMGEVVLVGQIGLIGEIIRIEGKNALIQVYEETAGLTVGEPVVQTGELLTVELGPGLLGSIFDGIQRPLPVLSDRWGDFIERGAKVYRLDRQRAWEFRPTVKPGDAVVAGSVVGEVDETERLIHKIMVPPGVSGVVAEVYPGPRTIMEAVVRLVGGEALTMRQKWSVRTPRPKADRMPLTAPLITGQRVIDALFPLAEGGTAIIPGGFGSGKTVLEQTIAKFAASEIIIYVGCGERGNEMTDTLEEMGDLTDPHTGRPLMERTILIANTSNMPVAAREASIYTGVTLAEYYRDMGYRVTVLADSTSRWAEALREISSRLEEIPGEEGYPTYLNSRLGAFYERAGRVKLAGRPDETGSVTIIGAVSPPGGDFSEPVTQASLRMASTFWGLDSSLAYQRHFPAIDWRVSYSLTSSSMAGWFRGEVGSEWPEMIGRINAILQAEEELQEIVAIVGADSLEDRERVTLEAGRLIREGILRQSAVHPVDAFCPIAKQAKMIGFMLDYIDALKGAIDRGVMVEEILDPPMAERVLRLKERPEEEVDDELADIRRDMDAFFTRLSRG
jgi:V/A-type H+-transporting ATPase subunit A